MCCNMRLFNAKDRYSCYALQFKIRYENSEKRGDNFKFHIEAFR